MRKRVDHEPEFGEIRPLQQGKPIEGEVVGLKPRKDYPFVYDVNVEFDPRRGSDQTNTSRPAVVASSEYRRGWEAIWGQEAREPDPGVATVIDEQPTDPRALN